MNLEFTELEKYYFELFHGALEVEEFEKWIYNNNDLEIILSQDDYFDIISLDYKSKHIKYEIEKILIKYIDYCKFEKKRVYRECGNVIRNF